MKQGLEIFLSNGESRHLRHLMLDFNGTIALDGRLLDGVARRLRRLAEFFNINVLTADTFGTVKRALDGLPLEIEIVTCGSEKLIALRKLGAHATIAIGNGANDQKMLEAAALSIGVIGPEGASPQIFSAKLVTHSITDAFDLLLNPMRIRAGLRA